MTRYALGLGSNVGDRLEHLRTAVSALSEFGVVVAVSSLYETDPIGGPTQSRFLNAVVVIDSDLVPGDLLGATSTIEAGRDRVRDVRWGPRTLDIDILVADGITVATDDLTLPHPRASTRRFVLAPLVEVWPGAEVGPGLTVAGALKSMRRQRVFRWGGDWMDGPPSLGWRAKAWVWAQLAVLSAWVAVAYSTGSPSSTGWVMATGAIIALGGAALGVAGIRSLGRELTPFPEARIDANLVATGPYRLVRHPIYGAVILGAVGVAVLQESWLAALATLGLVAFFWAKSTVEERSLTINVAGYDSYRARVTRRLLPGIL